MPAKNQKKKKWSPPKVPVINLKKYRGRQIAVVDGKIVADGYSTEEVLKKAKARYPKKSWEEILLISVPQERFFIFFYD